MRFGIRAKAIKNKPKVNKEYTVSELKVLLYAAKEEIKRKEKIIESLKGLEVNESKDYSFSVLNFTANEIMENVQQLERTKENLANEVRKNLKLQIENNEKQMALDKEKRENGKISVQLACSKTSVRIFEDEIKVKEENIRLHATKVVLLEQMLGNLEGNLFKSEGIIKELTEENEKQRNELKQIHQQIINFKCLESHNIKIQSSLDYEVALNKKQQEELSFLREKLENTITKNANIKELTENIKESISHQEKLRWGQEKMKILSDFERHMKKYELVYEDLKFFQSSYNDLQKKMIEDKAEIEKRMKKMQENNDGLKNSYENLNTKFKEICVEYELEKDRKLRLKNKLEILENQTNMIKTAENQQKLSQIGVSPLKPENKIVFTHHFRKTIKGGQNLHNFTPSPMKDHTRSSSSTILLSVGKENSIYNINF